MTIPVPDLNPIEYEWVELKRRSTNMDLKDLERFCMEEWSPISSGIIGDDSTVSYNG